MKMLFIVVLFLNIAYVQAHTQTSPQPPAAAQPAPQVLTPTDAEKLEMDSAAKDLRILQLEYKDAQNTMANAQTQMNELNTQFAEGQKKIDEIAKKVKDAHKWGDDVTFNKTNMQYEKTVKPAEVKKSETKPAEAPKK